MSFSNNYSLKIGAAMQRYDEAGAWEFFGGINAMKGSEKKDSVRKGERGTRRWMLLLM
jgi:hypothetical protein